MLAALHGLARHARIDQVECLWEPYMVLAARIREAFGLPGMTVEQTVPFRDKERMKQAARRGRHPHAVARQRDRRVAGVWEAAERIGYPLIVKPIAGAGSADTYRVDSAGELDDVLPMLRHVPEVSVEEFVDGRGVHLRHRLRGRRASSSRTSAGTARGRCRCAMPRVDQPDDDLAARPRRAAPARAAGRWAGRCSTALGFQTGFTHMEWYRKADGEVVFGEIGARPPGARVVDLMNYATDGDLYVGWAEAVAARPDARPLERRYNVGSIFKRARGVGHDHPRRRAGPAAGRVRRRGGARRPAAGRRAAARLAGHHRSATA